MSFNLKEFLRDDNNEDTVKLFAAIGAFVSGIILILTSLCAWMSIGIPACIVLFILGLIFTFAGIIPLIMKWGEWQNID